MFAVLVLCLIGATLAQRPVPCTSPPQFEARFHEVDEHLAFVNDGRLSYDSVYHRERIADEYEQGPTDDFFDILRLFDSQIEFVFNFRARNCTRRPLTRAWRDFGVQANATSYGEAYVGTSAFPGAGVLVSIWGGNFTNAQNQTVQYVADYTVNGCAPVSRTLFGQQLGIAHFSFYDVTVGIRDPNVFIPRRECLSDEEWNNRYTLFGH